MAFSNTWDETVPAGSEVRSLGDNRIRELKVGVRERISVEHLVGDNTDSPFGMHAYDIKTKTSADSPYTLTMLDNIVRVNASGGNISLVLPTAVAYDGKVFTIDKINSTNIVTITCNGAQTVGGYTSYKMKEAKRLYLMSNGTNWDIFYVSGADAKQKVGVGANGYSNLAINIASSSTGTITADYIYLLGSQGDVIRHDTVSVTFNMAIVGAGGLRSGVTEPAPPDNSWYYLFVISDGATPTGYIDTSATPTLPAGYSYYSLVGAVFNDDTSGFEGFYQSNNYVMTRDSGGDVISNGTATTETDINLSATTVGDIVAPLNAKRVELQVTLSYVSSGGYVTFNISRSGVDHHWQEVGNVNASVGNVRTILWVIPNAGIIRYANTTNGFGTSVKVIGWEY